MRVCVYAIMRDESHNVDGWLDCTSVADERFVLDTGSIDDTVERLDDAGCDLATAVFDPFRFDDARNTALAMAPEADLYLRLDADERLDNGWTGLLNRVYDPRVARYRYTVVNHGAGWSSHRREDCHVRAGQRWRYPTHEILVGPGPVLDVPLLTVHHHPPAARRPHHQTNLKVLQQATHEYPGDHRMAFYFARELWYTGNWAACRTAMVHFLDLPGGWGPERAEAYRILASIDDHPERWLWHAVGESPQRREPWVDLARHFLAAGQRESAVLAANFAYHRNDESIYTNDAHCWGEAFEALLREISELDPDEAHLSEP